MCLFMLLNFMLVMSIYCIIWSLILAFLFQDLQSRLMTFEAKPFNLIYLGDGPIVRACIAGSSGDVKILGNSRLEVPTK